MISTFDQSARKGSPHRTETQSFTVKLQFPQMIRFGQGGFSLLLIFPYSQLLPLHTLQLYGILGFLMCEFSKCSMYM